MVVMILTTGLRLLIRFTTTHVPGSDDAVVILATVSGNASQVGMTRDTPALTDRSHS